MKRIKTGIDVLLGDTGFLKGKRVGFLTNSSGITGDLRMDVDCLFEKGVDVVKLFGPEHGIWGAAADGAKVGDETEPRYGIPVYSLYGKTTRPTAEMLDGVDVMIYDIQDVGLRFYTFLYSLAYMMEECGKRGIKVVVLDRPNPLGGEIDGPVIKKELESFVGGYGLVQRYGMTVGEIAQYYNATFGMGVDLTVVKMEGWKRSMFYDETGLFWNTPSPNLPSLEHTFLYTGFCLLEGVNLSVGRGTAHPFKYVGAPWLDSGKLFEELNGFPHPGISFRERAFIPLTSKYTAESCRGLEFFVEDPKEMKPIVLTLDLIAIVKKLHPKMFEWDRSYHGANNRYHLDLLIGDRVYRERLDEGMTGQDLAGMWEKEVEEFKDKVSRFLIYE